MVFREQEWPRLGSSEDAPHVVVATVGRLLDCDEETANRLLQQITAPVFLVFATRPLPPRPYLDALQQALPHAISFFLCGDERPDPSLLAGGALTELPPLDEGVAERFIVRHKELMALAAPGKSTAEAPQGSSDSVPHQAE